MNRLIFLIENAPLLLGGCMFQNFVSYIMANRTTEYKSPTISLYSLNAIFFCPFDFPVHVNLHCSSLSITVSNNDLIIFPPFLLPSLPFITLNNATCRREMKLMRNGQIK